jgi:hypothetical protein
MGAYLDPRPIFDLLPGSSSDSELGERLEVDRLTIKRWRQGTSRLYAATADRVALRLGLHPANVWGDDWWTAP